MLHIHSMPLSSGARCRYCRIFEGSVPSTAQRRTSIHFDRLLVQATTMGQGPSDDNIYGGGYKGVGRCCLYGWPTADRQYPIYVQRQGGSLGGDGLHVHQPSLRE